MKTRQRGYGSMLLMGLTLLAVSCSQEPPTAGELKEFASVCDKANEGKRIAVEGYLRLPDSITSKYGVRLYLFQSPDFTGTAIGVSMLFGGQPNEMGMPPKDFSEEDLKVHLADGQVVGTGTKVRVSGTLNMTSGDPNTTCVLLRPFLERAE